MVLGAIYIIQVSETPEPSNTLDQGYYTLVVSLLRLSGDL